MGFLGNLVDSDMIDPVTGTWTTKATGNAPAETLNTPGGITAPVISNVTNNTPTINDVVPYEPGENAINSFDVPDQPPSSLASPQIPEEKLASGQLTSLLDENNAYMQQARAAGERSAQAKGLLNSTMAGTAGQSAAIAAAAPIATANSSALTTSDLSAQQAKEQEYLNYKNTTLQGLISSGLSQQEAEAQLALDTQQQAGANYRAEMEQAISLDQFAVNDREAVSTAMTNYGIQFQNNVSDIQTDESISAENKTAMIAVAQRVYASNMTNTAALYDIQLDWNLPV